MSDIQNPEPVSPAAAPPPPPVGQPIGQQAYPPAYAAAPPPGKRSTGKFVTGIVLTSLGGLWTLFGLRSIGIAIRSFGDNPAYAAGSIFGGVLIPVALLVIGIVLIRSSKHKAQ